MGSLLFVTFCFFPAGKPGGFPLFVTYSIFGGFLLIATCDSSCYLFKASVIPSPMGTIDTVTRSSTTSLSFSARKATVDGA